MTRAEMRPGTVVRIGGVTYCGDNDCSGCEYPAAYLDQPTGRYWARGSMTAAGPLMQILRSGHHRDGRTVDLSTVLTPEEQVWIMRRYYV